MGLVACDTGPSPEEQQAAENSEAWDWLEQAKADLQAKRQDLRDLRQAAADTGEEGSEAEPAEGEEGEDGEAPPSPEELEAQIKALEEEVIAKTDEFTQKLAEFINNQGLTEGAELTETQRKAFDLKAQEDILIAQEYIDKGGDYQRAIEIYTTTLLSDPENQLLLDAKAEAEELRYMTEERFAAVEKGMTQAEVREALGTPKTSNVREFDKGVLGWFYPREPAEGARPAAGVYFRQKKDVFRVYEADFDAISGETEEVDG
jgi:outer membrane protein assembly factor BamE (lipoprotein component of BamABCDE complex)